MNRVTEEGIQLIKRFEGFSPVPYRCPAGKITIGYGHVIRPGESFGRLTEAEATGLMLRDIGSRFAPMVAAHIKVPLNDNQFSALVSLAYNAGAAPLAKTLGRKLNDGDLPGAAREFDRWVNAGGRVLPGLVRRRAAERVLFLKPVT